MSGKFSVPVDEDHSKLPTLYWLSKLHKRLLKLIAADVYLTDSGLSCSYNKEQRSKDFAGLTTRSEHLLKAVKYVTWHN